MMKMKKVKRNKTKMKEVRKMKIKKAKTKMTAMNKKEREPPLRLSSGSNLRSGLIAKLLEKDPFLAYKTNQFWGQIVDRRYMCNFSEKEGKKLRSIQKHASIETVISQVSRLAVRVRGCDINQRGADTQATLMQVIKDLAAFKMSSRYYPIIF
ncbi:hypothetical protein F0562_002124 [Nyssa sinensis]|uniref:Uncharacterized protein n=1 Tax=Nyssa sinensis TaxID=561372 RepID=A0A5J5C8U9_9ASTE|nr:hypothetical protein F0562_002124 [Nyssa sinensis]